MSTPSVTLSIRLVPKGFTAVPDPRSIPARTVPFVWSEGERLWRSVEPLFVSAAKREGDGAYRAVSELADGPFYHTALRISGSPEDNAQTLQNRLDTELLQLVAPQRWSCLDCQRGFKKEKEAGPCARHKKEMPPVVLYRTTHPRVNRLGEYYVFGYARDYESTTPIAEHNDETWSPSLEAAAAEYEVLRETERRASEAGAAELTAYAALSPAEKRAAFNRALFGEDHEERFAAARAEGAAYDALSPAEKQAAIDRALFGEDHEERFAAARAEGAAYDALSPAEKQAAIDRALFGTDTSGGPGSWAPAPEFTAEQQAAIRAFTANGGGSAVDWLLKNSSNGPDLGRGEGEDFETVGYIYGAFGCEDLFTSTFGPFDEEWQPLPKTRPTVDQGIDKMVSTFRNLWDLITCSEYEEIEGLLRAFGREQEADRCLREHALGSSGDVEPCFGKLVNVGETLADLVARGVVAENDHQRRILALYRA